MCTILIVEDEFLEQEFLKSIAMEKLQTEDTLLVCGSGVEAIKLSKQYKPDIIIMDIMITEMDGLSAIEKIREFLPDVCISVISAYSDFFYAQKSISLSVFEYLLKPVKPEDFKCLLTRMIEEIKKCNQSVKETYTHVDLECIKNQQYVIQKSVDYIKKHFQEKLTLEKVASEIFMNPKYFSRIFKKEIGISFSKYVNTLKIKHACKLLETTDYPAYRISMECGFSDPSYFNRIFRKHMNMTPQLYRKYIRDSQKVL